MSQLVLVVRGLFELIKMSPLLFAQVPKIYKLNSKIISLYIEELAFRRRTHKPNNGVNYTFEELQIHGAEINAEWQILLEEHDSWDLVIDERLKVLRQLSLFVRNDEQANKIRRFSSVVYFRDPSQIYSLLSSGVNPIELLLQFKTAPIMQHTILHMLPNIPRAALATINESLVDDKFTDLNGKQINIRDTITFEFPEIPVSYQGVVYDFKYVTPELLRGRLGYAVGNEIDIRDVQFDLRVFNELLKRCNSTQQSKFKTNWLHTKSHVWQLYNDVMTQRKSIQLYPDIFVGMFVRAIAFKAALPLNAIWLIFASHRLATIANIGSIFIHARSFTPGILAKEYYKHVAANLLWANYVVPALLTNIGNEDDLSYFKGDTYNNILIPLNFIAATLAFIYAVYANRSSLLSLYHNVTYDYKSAQDSLVNDIEQSISLKPELANTKQFFFWKQVLDERASARINSKPESVSSEKSINLRVCNAIS